MTTFTFRSIVIGRWEEGTVIENIDNVNYSVSKYSTERRVLFAEDQNQSTSPTLPEPSNIDPLFESMKTLKF